jgi:hypothetical protein
MWWSGLGRDTAAAVRVIGGVLALAAVLAGCGGSSGGGSSGSGQRTLLEQTLGQIRDDPSVLAYFEFGDIAGERSLAGVPAKYGAGHPAARWQRILGGGADYFREDPSGKKDGLDILTGSTAVEIGQPPHTGGLITGPLVDGPKVRAAVEKLGAVPGTVAGQPGLTWGREGTEHLEATDQFGIGPGLGEFDRAIITAHTVIAGRYTSEVATLAGGGTRTAAADPTLAATSACLGDVVVASGERPPAGASVEVSAGVRRGAATAPAQEVLCVVPSGGRGHLTGATLCSRIGPDAQMRFGGEPPSQFDTRATPENGQVDGTRWSGCTITDRAATPAGWLLDVLLHGSDVDALVAP